MKKLNLLSGVAGALLLTAACSSPAPNTNTTTNGNAANRNANTAANTAASPAASPAANANSGSAQQGAAQDFSVVNRTGVEIDKLYVAPNDSDDWEEDILGQDTLPDGQTVNIKFNREEKAALWDLRIEDKQGNAIEWEKLDLLKISKVTLFYKDGKGTAEVE